tara:strand:- start:4663 stop:4818 length:156 start_codon:yes stop_codon:yes gene_type:complete
MATSKLYFDSEEQAMAYSAAEAESRGCNMTSTIYWYGWEEDENGWYLEVDN